MMGVHWDWMMAYIYDLLGLISVTIQNYSIMLYKIIEKKNCYFTCDLDVVSAGLQMSNCKILVDVT